MKKERKKLKRKKKTKMNRNFYDYQIPQETFVQNNLGKNLQISNDSDVTVLIEFNENIHSLFPNEIIYVVLYEECKFTIYPYDNSDIYSYYTRSNSNMISLKRDAGDRIIPVFYFSRF